MILGCKGINVRKYSQCAVREDNNPLVAVTVRQGLIPK